MTIEQRSEQPVPVTGASSRQKRVIIGLAVFAALALAIEHRAHLSGWLSAYGIWLVVLACPLMHLFMHHGHGGHGGRKPARDDPDRRL